MNDNPHPIYTLGQDPVKDARYSAFFLENHLDHNAYPDEVASPEQIGFMVHLEGNDRYYPCAERMFNAIMTGCDRDYLISRYNQVFARIMEIINEKITSQYQREYLKALICMKFEHETRDFIMIPSRLEKRLFKIIHNHAFMIDTYLEDKKKRNSRVARCLKSSEFKSAVNSIDISKMKNLPDTLSKVREELERVELRRLIALTAAEEIWETDAAEKFTIKDYERILNSPIGGGAKSDLFEFLGVNAVKAADSSSESKKILWIANESGEFLVDMAIIRYLTRLGHKVIVALKEGPFFKKVSFDDMFEDSNLREFLATSLIIRDNRLTKNELIDILRRDQHLFLMPDGTREDMNLLMTSTAFARVFKEVDGIITRGPDQKRRIFDSRFTFTQDIFNISKNEDGTVDINLKCKHSMVIHFSHKDLEEKADAIIEKMRAAKNNGMSVMFYSGIVGSIPGKIDEAIKIMATFIDYLNNHLLNTFIINPSKYYEPGMDADDLMYMWEIVQRSGCIDIWRFQTSEDIATAFEIIGEKIPPEWSGKDATYSTGCTKEMAIAEDVLKKHPEMQIIGPPKEKFMRRKEYGVGMMHDRRLGGRTKP